MLYESVPDADKGEGTKDPKNLLMSLIGAHLDERELPAAQSKPEKCRKGLCFKKLGMHCRRLKSCGRGSKSVRPSAGGEKGQ